MWDVTQNTNRATYEDTMRNESLPKPLKLLWILLIPFPCLPSEVTTVFDCLFVFIPLFSFMMLPHMYVSRNNILSSFAFFGTLWKWYYTVYIPMKLAFLIQHLFLRFVHIVWQLFVHFYCCIVFHYLSSLTKLAILLSMSIWTVSMFLLLRARLPWTQTLPYMFAVTPWVMLSNMAGAVRLAIEHMKCG